MVCRADYSAYLGVHNHALACVAHVSPNAMPRSALIGTNGILITHGMIKLGHGALGYPSIVTGLDIGVMLLGL